ncbi:M56 family metallopeptidase [Streptosporangium sp. NPDC002721]|uniref:M56 family metallopeptidase n=1 Tax=Streptosporangium sp. NPDC002721 TaxID=3366188 RepID=UPI0036A9932A
MSVTSPPGRAPDGKGDGDDGGRADESPAGKGDGSLGGREDEFSAGKAGKSSAGRYAVAPPSPARARYLLLVIVLVLAGGFAGQSVFAITSARSWLASMRRCAARAAEAFPGDRLASIPHEQACMVPAELERVLWVLGGALSVLGVGVVLMLLLPYRMARRAGPFRAASPVWEARVQAAARRMGVRRAPAVVFGSLRLEEPFTVGRPGKPLIILPPGTVNLPPDRADAVIRHEMAHVAAGDVTLVWLTRGVWWALVPALLTPLFMTYGVPVLFYAMSTFHHADLTIQQRLVDIVVLSRTIFLHPHFLDYTARSGVLLVMASLVASAVLRAREHEADLRSVSGRRSGPLQALLAGQRSPREPWWRRLTAIHPAPERRLAAVRRPELAFHSPAADAVATGALAGMTLLALYAVTPYVPFFSAGSAPWSGSTRLAGLVVGLLLGAAWGMAVWRAVLAARAGGHAPRGRVLLPGLLAGFALGMMVHIWAAGRIGAVPLNTWAMVVVPPLAVAGAGACSLALAEPWARRYDGVPVPLRGWLAAALVNVAVFTGGLWSAQEIVGLGPIASRSLSGVSAGPAGWWEAYLRSGMFSGRGEMTVAGLAGISALVWWWTTRARRPAPGSAPGWGGDLSRTASPLLPARIVLFAAVAAAVAALTVRWTARAVLEESGAHAFQFDVLAASGAGVACLLAVLVLGGAAGTAQGVAGATSSTLLVALALWLRDLTAWCGPPEAIRSLVVVSGGLLALTVLTVALPAALLPGRLLRWRPGSRAAGRATVRTVCLAALFAALVVGTVIYGGDDLLLKMPPPPQCGEPL